VAETFRKAAEIFDVVEGKRTSFFPLSTTLWRRPAIGIQHEKEDNPKIIQMDKFKSP
jgi:hypothetical protein